MVGAGESEPAAPVEEVRAAHETPTATTSETTQTLKAHRLRAFDVKDDFPLMRGKIIPRTTEGKSCSSHGAMTVVSI
jgi:hypothetical protein